MLKRIFKIQLKGVTALLNKQSISLEITEETIKNSFPPEVSHSDYNTFFGLDCADIKTAGYAIANPIDALSIGSSDKGSDNISTRVSRFVERNEVYATDNYRGGEGDFANAIRHTLWQAYLANKYSESEATAIGNAHEIDHNVSLSDRRFQKLSDADRVVDLLNNRIGRQIGVGRRTSMNKLAIDVIEILRRDGLYVANKKNDGSWYIDRVQITEKQYLEIKELYDELNNLGRKRDEQIKRDEETKKELEIKQRIWQNMK